MKTKVCTKCGIKKKLSEFCKSKAHKGGDYPQCKECHRLHNKKYRQGNKGKILIENKKYYEEHKEKIKKL